MANWRMTTTDEEIDAAIERAKLLPERPTAISAEYIGGNADVVVLRLSTGGRLTIPREELQGLQDATEAQLSEIEIFAGLDIAWPQLDVNHYLPYLMQHQYGSDAWMQTLAQRGVAA